MIEDIYKKPRKRSSPKTKVSARAARPVPRRVAVSQPPQAKIHFPNGLKWAGLVVIMLFTSSFFYKNIMLSAAEKDIIPPKPPAAVSSESPVDSTPPVDVVALENSLTAIIQKYPQLQISVAYKDLNSSASLHAGVKEGYIAASTGKLLSATLYLQQVEKGQHSLEEIVGNGSAKSQLQLLIEDSDNAAWSEFRNLLTHEALTVHAREIGLSNYDSSQNIGTSSDIAVVLEALYNNKLLNKYHTELLLSYMQNASEDQYIPAAIPAGVKVYHKAGWLQDRMHDAAIVDDGQRPFALVIFTKANNGHYNFALGAKIAHEITQAVWAAHQPQ